MILPQKLYNGVMPNTLQTVVFTSPAGKITTIKFSFIVNTNVAQATVNLYKQSGTTITRLITPDCPLDHNESLETDGVIQLEPGDQVLADTSAASGVTLVIDGFSKDA